MPDGQPDRPNFIVVTTDQQRYDTLGVTGNDIVQTPNFDALAQRGTLFTHAYAQGTVCIPSRACLHTGRYCHQHGLQYMETVIDTTPPLPPWETTFMERLQAAGYRTGAVGKIHMMRPKGYHELQLTGGKGARWIYPIGQDIGPGPLGHDYAAWLEERRPGGYQEIYQQRQGEEYRKSSTVINVLEEDEYVDYWVAEMALEFLKRRSEDHREPWFLWVGFCGPHGPFDPPRRFAEMYPVEEMPFPETFLSDLGDKPEFMRRERPSEVSEEQRYVVLRRIAYYYAMMSQIDEMMGRILSALEDLGFADNTIITTTSDHGEMLGDLGRWGKGNFLEQVIHMPTIMALPDGDQPERFEGLVENFSIAPTVLDYAGVERPPEMQAPTLRPILEGGGEATEAALCEYVDNNRAKAGKCLRTGRYKYVTWGVEYTGELYDLEEDPRETRNLWNDPAYAGVRQEMGEAMLDRLMHSQEPAYTSYLTPLPEHTEFPAWERR